MAIVAVIKCCVSFRDGRVSYTEEKNKISQKVEDSTEINANKLLPSNGYKLNFIIGASVLTLIILILK